MPLSQLWISGRVTTHSPQPCVVKVVSLNAAWSFFFNITFSLYCIFTLQHTFQKYCFPPHNLRKKTKGFLLQRDSLTATMEMSLIFSINTQTSCHILWKDDSKHGFTWTGYVKDAGRWQFPRHCTLPQRRSRQKTVPTDPPRCWSTRGILSSSNRNRKATVQMFTDNSCFLPGPWIALHCSPLSLMFQLQYSCTATGSSHKPDIIRFWIEKEFMSENIKIKLGKFCSSNSLNLFFFLLTCWLLFSLGSWGGHERKLMNIKSNSEWRSVEDRTNMPVNFMFCQCACELRIWKHSSLYKWKHHN